MNHPWLTFLSIGVIAVAVFIFFSIRLQPIEISQEMLDSIASETLDEPTVTFVNPSRGAEEPLVTIIEFSDFECAACKTVSTSLDVVLATYPNEVAHVWKNLPNESIHEFSTPAAIAAHCADRQGYFWDYHDEIYNRQTYLSNSQFTQIAQDVGLDVEKFQNCFDSRDTLPIVKKDYEEGIALGLTSTPTMFIGDQIIVGAVTSDTLLDAVRSALDAQ